MEWDDLKYFLELAQTRTLTAAAKRLQVRHSTVARRVTRLERLQGGALFARSHEGYVLNAAGRALLPHAKQIQKAFLQLSPQTTIAGNRPSGTVRIACPEGFGTYFVAHWVTRLRGAYPEISIDLVVQPRTDLLARNKADILIHIDRPSRGPYLVSKLFEYQLSLFASTGYLAQYGEPKVQTELTDHHFVSYVPELEPARDLPNASSIAHAKDPQFRATALATQKAAVLAGFGIALLPDYVMAGAPEAVKILGHQIGFRRAYYMLVPEQGQSVPRISAVWNFLKTEFGR